MSWSGQDLYWESVGLAIVAIAMAAFQASRWIRTRANKDLGMTLFYLAIGTNMVALLAGNSTYVPAVLKTPIFILNIALLGAAIFFIYRGDRGVAPPA